MNQQNLPVAVLEAVPKDGAAAACERLKTAFPGRVTSPDAVSEYEEAITRPWSQTCWTSAAAYVRLSNADEVAKALDIVKATGAKFAIRTTGHNPNAGFSNVADMGVVLDIRPFQSKDIGQDGFARFGAGNTWGEVYAWLEERKLSAIGGRDGQVGLAGFLLGGGMGAFPNLHGLGLDGVKNFEVVLADGTLVSANTKSNADLYRALKGGGSNLGIVTRFDLKTHPLIQVQYTIKLFNPEDYNEIIKATIHVQEAMEKDSKIGLFVNFNQGFVAVGLLYADWPSERPAAFEPFYNLTSQISEAAPTTNGTLLSLAQAMGHPQTPQRRCVGTATTQISQGLYASVYKAWVEASKGLPNGAALHYTIQPVGKAGVQAGEDEAGNTMGLDKVPQCWWVFTCEWPQECDDKLAQTAVDSMVKSVQTLAKDKGLLLDYLCMTFATASQKVLQSYGADNFRKLQEAAAKYDPEGVFQKWQNDGFLLRNDV